MSQPAIEKSAYEQLLELPEHQVGEVLGGRLYAHPRPAPRHARTGSALGYRVGGPFDGGIGGPGGWWILDEPELHLNNDILVPDLAGWRRERLPELPETAWFELPPDWACEILSPSTARTDRALKMPIYAREGIRHLWLIDPDAHTLEVYQLNDDRHWLLVETLKDDDEVRQPPFDAIGFPLDSLWA